MAGCFLFGRPRRQRRYALRWVRRLATLKTGKHAYGEMTIAQRRRQIPHGRKHMTRKMRIAGMLLRFLNGFSESTNVFSESANVSLER